MGTAADFNQVVYVSDRATLYSVIAHTNCVSTGSGVLPEGFGDERSVGGDESCARSGCRKRITLAGRNLRFAERCPGTQGTDRVGEKSERVYFLYDEGGTLDGKARKEGADDGPGAEGRRRFW